MNASGSRVWVRWCVGLGVGLAGLMPQATKAEVITPTNVFASTYYSGMQAPANLINGSGLDTSSGDVLTFQHAPDESAAGMWCAGAGQGVPGATPVVANQYVVFDLGANYDLSYAYLWQMVQPNLLVRGIRQFRMLASSSAPNPTDVLNPPPSYNLTGFTEVLTTSILAMARGPASYPYPVHTQAFPLTGATNVRQIYLDIIDCHSGLANDYVGLSEVKFHVGPVNRPSNDNRSQAIELSWFGGSVVGNSALATTDGVAPCGGVRDVWYEIPTFTLGCLGAELNLDTCGSVFDTTLMAYLDWFGLGCGNLDGMGTRCDDDGAACDSGAQSRVSLELPPFGATACIRIASAEGHAGGPYALNWTLSEPPPPAHSECAGAIPVTLGTWTNSNTCSAGAPVGSQCSDYLYSFVWHTYTPSCDESLDIQAGFSGHPAAIKVFTGTCGNLTEVECGSSYVNLVAQAGTTYYISIASFIEGHMTEFGNYSLTLTANDRCMDARAVHPGDSCGSDNTSTFADLDLDCGGLENDVWYTYSADCDQRVLFDLCGSQTPGMHLGLFVFDSPCENPIWVDCGEYGGLGPCENDTDAYLYLDATAGTTYYVRVTAGSGGPGPFVLNVATAFDPNPASGETMAGWGWNLFGQAQVPAPPVRFVAIDGGERHSVVLQSDGALLAWGDNTDFQLNIPAPNGCFTAVAAGGRHNLGLKQDGSIAAWGANAVGQTAVPPPNEGFIAVAAGQAHSLGVKWNGTVIAWGINSEGQTAVPEPNRGFVAMGSGRYHALGLWGIDPNDMIPPDLNGDGYLAGEDFNVLSGCMTGANAPYQSNNPPLGCPLAPDNTGLIAADLDGDGDVDLIDFSIYQPCHQGEGVPADPACMD